MISETIESESLLDICCHLDVARDGVSPRPRRSCPPPSLPLPLGPLNACMRLRIGCHLRA